LPQHCDAVLSIIVALADSHQYSDPPRSLCSLRPRRARPRGRAANQSDEVAPSQADHATTSQWTDHGILSLSLQ